MNKNNFRAVLTIFNDNKIMEIRFENILGENINVKSSQVESREKVNQNKLLSVIFKIIGLINGYGLNLKTRIEFCKKIGVIK